MKKCEVCQYNLSEWELDNNCTLLKCKKCTHIQRNLNLSKNGSRAHAWGGAKFFDRVRLKLTKIRLDSIIKKKGQLKILEIGFGNGQILSEFLKKGHDIYGVDPDMLEIEIIPEVKRKGNLFSDKIEKIDFKKTKFDIIYGVHVIEHLDNPAKVFQKCKNILKPDGLMYFITPNGSSASIDIFKGKWWFLEDPTHLRFFTNNSIKYLLNKIGFKQIITSRPIWDSLTFEINSFLKFFDKKSGSHGILSKLYSKIIDILLLPLTLTLRIFYPKIIPSIEIIAKLK